MAANAPPVPLDEVLLGAQGRGIDIQALDEALDLLAKIDGRKARVVELRYFGGLSVEETGNYWRMAKAWVFAALTGQQDHASSSRAREHTPIEETLLLPIPVAKSLGLYRQCEDAEPSVVSGTRALAIRRFVVNPRFGRTITLWGFIALQQFA